MPEGFESKASQGKINPKIWPEPETKETLDPFIIHYE
jgi:hypothetical protein